MKNITNDMVFSLDCFSKEGWKKINKIIKEARNYNGDCNKAADLFLAFREIWCEDHNIWIDFGLAITEPNVYHNENGDLYYYDGDLESDLLDRFAECVEGD